MRLEDAKNNIGNRVRYIPASWKEDIGNAPIEYGIITGYNYKYIFVRYTSDVNSKATSPEDLSLLFNNW